MKQQNFRQFFKRRFKSLGQLSVLSLMAVSLIACSKQSDTQPTQAVTPHWLRIDSEVHVPDWLECQIVYYMQ